MIRLIQIVMAVVVSLTTDLSLPYLPTDPLVHRCAWKLDMFQWTINFCVEVLMCLDFDVSTEASDIDYALVINFILLRHFITKCGLWEISFLVDLRDDKQFLADHPGAVPITTAQVCAVASHVQIYI